MNTLPPIFLTDLFPVLNEKLVTLLCELTPDEWQRPTVCAGWNVKDIAAHLLDVNLRRIAAHRDGYRITPSSPIHSYRELVAYLNQLNADWVRAAKRISPQSLIEWLTVTNEQVCTIFKNLDAYAKAPFSVAWAGETESSNWFDVAREYTERWHHQQQIRLAVYKPGILTRELYYPLLDTFMRALPHTYRHTDAGAGTLLQFTVTGEAGGNWFLYRMDAAWKLMPKPPPNAAVTSTVRIPPDIAWRLFSNGMKPDEAATLVAIEGDRRLGSVVLGMRSVMV